MKDREIIHTIDHLAQQAGVAPADYAKMPLPVAIDTTFACLGRQIDTAFERIENNIKINDYVLGQWELQTAFVADIPHYAVGPRIGEWVTHSIDAPIFTGAGTVTLK